MIDNPTAVALPDPMPLIKPMIAHKAARGTKISPIKKIPRTPKTHPNTPASTPAGARYSMMIFSARKTDSLATATIHF